MAIATLPFDVETAVVCDEIRQEANGKYLLIGVYGGNIVVRGFPTDLRLSIWLLGKSHSAGEVTIRIRVRGPQDATLVEGEMDVKIDGPSRATIMAIAGLPIQVQREGKMTIELASKAAEDWIPVKSLDLLLAPRSLPPG